MYNLYLNVLMGEFVIIGKIQLLNETQSNVHNNTVLLDINNNAFSCKCNFPPNLQFCLCVKFSANHNKKLN